MSVIAFDGKMVAVDRQATFNETKTTMRKMRVLPDGTVLAWCGAQAQGLLMARWYEDGADITKYPESQRKEEDYATLIVFTNGRIFMYERTTEPLEVLDKMFAQGCGRDFALGAMEAGCDAVKAVKIASKFSVYCGMGVDYCKIGKKG
jgi:ATP-dependent protease HslVU (ClpYQ) peptidase subunit